MDIDGREIAFPGEMQGFGKYLFGHSETLIFHRSLWWTGLRGRSMAKHPVMMKYSYELKENLARRALAQLIDLTVVGIPLFILFVFFGLGVLQSNPMNAIVGLLGPLLYTQQVQGVSETSPFIAMIVFVIFQSFLLPLYYYWRECNSRRTLGKYLMHLDPVRKDNYFPTKWDALQRNYVKYIAGAVGGYLLGFVGWYLFICLAALIDLKMGPEYKMDVRQRLTEVPFGTAVLVERPKVPFGEIAVDGGRWARLREKEKKARKFAKQMKKEEKAGRKMSRIKVKEEVKREHIKKNLTRSSKKLELALTGEGAERKTSSLLEKVRPGKRKQRVNLVEEEEMEEVLELESDTAGSGDLEESKEEKISPMEEEPEVPKTARKLDIEMEEEEPKPGKKLPFWKRLFGGGKKHHDVEGEAPAGDTAPGPGMDRPLAAPLVKKDAERDEIILQFMMDFDIDEDRAKGLYDMGYRKKEDLKDAIPQDLMMIRGLNPTIAKRIISRANE
ncbi:hypothetical protein B6U90_05305 [Thermoplasmatales archaeon ex4484_6]|nr:MAG: hypothetical protein B6U90_05305 [Thermoplasmatales archaeon ex4484_6]RLF65694.1 MAG: hypothetical protein DRN57_08580 [Thermoplasmata archaeon]